MTISGGGGRVSTFNKPAPKPAKKDVPAKAGTVTPALKVAKGTTDKRPVATYGDLLTGFEAIHRGTVKGLVDGVEKAASTVIIAILDRMETLLTVTVKDDKNQPRKILLGAAVNQQIDDLTTAVGELRRAIIAVADNYDKRTTQLNEQLQQLTTAIRSYVAEDDAHYETIVARIEARDEPERADDTRVATPDDLERTKEPELDTAGAY